jgi:hypothetical protein
MWKAENVCIAFGCGNKKKFSLVLKMLPFETSKVAHSWNSSYPEGRARRISVRSQPEGKTVCETFP